MLDTTPPFEVDYGIASSGEIWWMSLRRKLANATLWSALGISGNTVLRIASAIVASRLLSVDDFGVLAFVFASSAILEQLSYFGLESALIQRKEITSEDLDVAWTFEFLRKILIATLFLLATPLCEHLIRDDRVRWVIPLSALALAVSALRNNGLVHFRREFNFRPLFFIDLVPVLTNTLVTVVGLQFIKHIGIIVAAQLASSVSLVITAHILCSHRPRFAWNKQKILELLKFGTCLLGNTIVRLIRDQGTEMGVGGIAGAAMLGFFNRGRVFCANIFSQVEALVCRVAYPLLAKQHHTETGLHNSFLSLLACSFFLAPLLTVGYAMAAPDLVPLVLTTKWNPIIPFLQLFCFIALTRFLLAPAEIAFQAIGKPQLGTVRQTASLVIFLCLVFPYALKAGAEGVISAGITANVFLIPSYVSAVRKHVCQFRPESILRWITPVAAGIAGLIAAYNFTQTILTHPLAKLLAGGAASAAAYVLAFLIAATLIRSSQPRHIKALLPERLASKHQF